MSALATIKASTLTAVKARVVKLVYTGDLKFPANRHVGSSPTTGTIHQTNVETFEEFNAGTLQMFALTKRKYHVQAVERTRLRETC